MSVTTDRVHRALSEFLHAERIIADSTEMFWVHSNSDERYAVDFVGGKVLCTCDNWKHGGGPCKHIWHCLLTDPDALDELLDT